MKLLILGLAPLLIFWGIESKFGTLWGLVAAVVWSVGECAYEWYKFKKVSRVTLVSSGLVVGLGAISLYFDNGVFFKFQPVIMEVLFAGILIFAGKGGEPFLMQMARQTRPEIFATASLELLEAQRSLFKRFTRNLVVFICLHSGLLSYVALKGTTGEWAFWKGVGFNLALGLWLVLEFVLLRRTKRNSKS
jgi:intracellular septation protein